MKQKEEKIGFFKRFKKAVFELEDYGFFLGEKLTVAFKYFFTLIFVISLIFSVAVTNKAVNIVNKVYSYLVNELPDFEFKDNKLTAKENICAYDEEYEFTFLIDTTESLTESEIKNYKDKVYSQGGNGLIFLKDKLVLISDSAEDTTQYSEYFTGQNILETEENGEEIVYNKEKLIGLIDEIGINKIIGSIFLIVFVNIYILNVIVILRDVCVIGIFGWFAARLCGVNIKINPMLAISIYGLSLSIVLDLIMDIIYISTGFVAEYFSVIYLLIAYVYIIAAIFMVKYDLIKHTEELKKILEVQKQIEKDLANEKKNQEQEELEEKEEISEDKEEEKTEENRDPDGSEI